MTIIDNGSIDAAALRAHNLARLLRAVRAQNEWSVEQAAITAKIGHMTWRRLEAGQPVRLRTFTAIDRLLGQPPGTTPTALDSDEHMAALYRAVTGSVLEQATPEPPPALVEVPPSPRPHSGRKAQPIRSTMDLPPDEHAEFLKGAVDAATTTGQPVKGQNVLRALVRRWLADPELQQAIVRDLAQGNGKA